MRAQIQTTARNWLLFFPLGLLTGLYLRRAPRSRQQQETLRRWGAYAGPGWHTQSAEPRARTAYAQGARTVAQVATMGHMGIGTASKWLKVIRTEQATVTSVTGLRAVR